MKTRRSAALGIGFILLAALPAAAFVAANGLRVRSDGTRAFVVLASPGKTGVTDYWCAAGDFAIRSLGLAPGTRLYRLTPGSPTTNGLRFSLDEEGAVPSGVTVFGAKDSGLSASLAQVYCRSMKEDSRFDR